MKYRLLFTGLTAINSLTTSVMASPVHIRSTASAGQPSTDVSLQPELSDYSIADFMASDSLPFPNIEAYTNELDEYGDPLPAENATLVDVSFLSDRPAFANLITLDKSRPDLLRCYGTTQECVEKPNAPLKTHNGCGPGGFLNNILPGREKFRWCCDRHDECYDTCSQEFVICNDQFALCMQQFCDAKSGIHKIWCEAERVVYWAAVSGSGAIEHWRASGEKRCDCVGLGIADPWANWPCGGPDQGGGDFSKCKDAAMGN